MTSPAKRVWTFLRSRKLAIWLLLIVVAYSFVGTIVPQRGRDLAGVERWAATKPELNALAGSLGLYDAFRAPLFLVVITLLFASTAACAWERTRASLKQSRTRAGLTEADVARLTAHPQIVVPLPAGTTPDATLATVRAALARLRLKSRAGKRAGEAVGGRWGLLGSPVFHWALAALFLTIGLGQLTRAEGLIGVPIGYTVQDTEASYGRYEPGPLHGPRATGLTIGATDFVLAYMDGTVDRGPSAIVSLYRDGRVVARQRVYPNSPLRYGALLIHQNDYGLAAALRVESATGREIAHSEPIVDFDPNTPSGTTVSAIQVTPSGATQPTDVDVTVLADHEGRSVLKRVPSRREVKLTVRAPGQPAQTVTLAVGDTYPLPNGEKLRLTDVTFYTRLSVADDWSIYPIYALFVVAGFGISLAVFTPYRKVRFLLVDGEGGPVLHADARHARRDPLFAERVETALREALGAPADEKGPDR